MHLYRANPQWIFISKLLKCKVYVLKVHYHQRFKMNLKIKKLL